MGVVSNSWFAMFCSRFCRRWAVKFLPMPTPKTLCRTFPQKKWIQSEVCRTLFGRCMGMKCPSSKEKRPSPGGLATAAVRGAATIIITIIITIISSSSSTTTNHSSLPPSH